MIITIEKKYLTFPVNTNASSKKILMYEGDTLLYDLDCKIDLISPNYTAYVDVSRFTGKSIRIEIDPFMDVEIGSADQKELPLYGNELYRPQVHFSVRQGWNNDPNGLILHEGIYHMFYQYNPCSNEWDNMHWGHATSRDLLHWEEQDIALYPDDMGTMFSGCAIADERNVSGLGDGKTPPLLLFYTAAGNSSTLSKGKKFTQCLAYSLDGGKTLQKYANNPIIENLEGENRDPKVVWVEELGKYVMALFIARNDYALFTSDDLLHWTHLQNISFEIERECPDLFCLMLDGERYWVLMGASDYYLVGRFNESGFVPVQKQIRLNCNRFAYAAQSFSGTEEGSVIRIAWDRIKIPDTNFSQQMGFPVQMKLRRMGDKIVLCAEPIASIASLYDTAFVKNGSLGETPVRFDTEASSMDIRLELPYDPEAVLSLRVRGSLMTLNMRDGWLKFEKTRVPIAVREGMIDVRLVSDKASVEIFACEGRYYFADQFLCDFNLPYVELSANKEVKDVSFSCHTLCSTL